MTPLYTAEATSKGGRAAGRTMLAEGGIAVATSLPKSMGGDAEGSNPEQLFALGYANCFNQAVLVVGGQKKLDVTKATVTVKATINKADDGGFALSAELIGGFPGLSHEQGHEIMEAAHQMCPYSKATRGNMPVKLSVA